MVVTKRDHKLLEKIHVYGMLSTTQINQLIFNGIAKTTTLRRLRILEGQRLIQRISGLESHEYLWGLTFGGAQLIGRELIKRHWNKNLLDHDYKLLCLRLTLEKHGMVKNWTPEHELRQLVYEKYGHKEAKNKLVPDGIIITASSGKKQAHALELELTLKNKTRIDEIVRRYLKKKELASVIYIASSKGIIRSFLRTWKDLASQDNGTQLYGSLFNEVMKNPQAVMAYGLKGPKRLLDILGAHPLAHKQSILHEQRSEVLSLVNAANHTTTLEIHN